MSEQSAGRFAPTPSGRMHLGNILCAMISWLSVRARGGRYVLRIEDLDRNRSPRSLADQIEDDLRWFGIDWDEGGSKGGSDYYQSECFDIYQHYLAQLDRLGLLYPCFCTRAQLHTAQAPHRSDGTYVYPGTCRSLTDEQRRKRAAVRAPAIRCMVPDRVVGFQDKCAGWYQENLAEACGDFIVRRSDGVYAYQLAVVVDDARMGMTEVVRGCDLIASTARQLYLYEMLKLPAPDFYHIPLLVAPDGRRLSKREKDLDLGVLRTRFGTPERLIGLLAHAAGFIDRAEPLTMCELIAEFAWNRLPKRDIVLPRALMQ